MRPDFFLTTRSLRDRAWVGYTIALAAPILSLAIRPVASTILRNFTFLPFFPAVLLASFMGGWGPGLLAIIWSVLLVAAFILDPRPSAR